MSRSGSRSASGGSGSTAFSLSRLFPPAVQRHGRIGRRDFFLLAGGAALSAFAASAEERGLPKIGFLSPTSMLTPQDRAFLQELEKFGYVDGRTVRIEFRFAGGMFERLPDLAAGLVRLDVDIIVARVTQASLAASKATGKIPIVMLAVSDPIASGLVETLARPGSNVTGTASMNAEVVGKSMEILKEIVPHASRLAVLWNPGNPVFQEQLMGEAERSAVALQLGLSTFAVESPDDIVRAFAKIADARIDALLVLADPILIRHQQLIVSHAARSRLPAIYGTRETAVAGGLVSYGPDMEVQFRRAASYVDRILKGAAPAELPVEQPTEFELVVNLETAQALGLAFPASILARADEVIE